MSAKSKSIEMNILANYSTKSGNYTSYTTSLNGKQGCNPGRFSLSGHSEMTSWVLQELLRILVR